VVDGGRLERRRHCGLAQARAVFLYGRTGRLHFDLALEMQPSGAADCISIWPWKNAPSVIPTRGAKTLPLTLAVARMFTDSVAYRSPSTLPSTTMTRARMSPFMVPSVPTVRLCVCVIEPSTLP